MAMHDLRAAIREREPVAGAWLSIGHPMIAEIKASLGFEFVLIDTEHASIGIETLENLVRAVDAAGSGARTVVRVPSPDPAHISRVLDTGVDGIMVPQVETVETAEDIVAATRYPPDGRRGVAAARAANYGLDFEEYVETADESILVLVQIESERAVENAGSIAAVAGIDGLYVGPADLSKSMGTFFELDGERFRTAMNEVLAAAHAEDTAVGIFVADRAHIEPWLGDGFDFFTLGFDTQFIIEGNQRMRAEFEAALDDSNPTTE